jgi:16S rRNA (adenine1518-N6/adenine1519-N6)-dimethyltransferase
MGASVNVRDVLNGLGIDPKQSLGQNFMVEANALARLVEAADLSPGDAVLEIGAGLGALTAVLAERARRVVAVEIDGRFIAHLRGLFADTPGVEVVQADILEADIAALMGPDAGDYRVVANVPYYITSAILRHLLENPTPPRVLVITVQREVAERITAGPGDMSLLAVSVQFYGEPRVITRLSRGNFYPQPSVESAILRVDARPGGPPLPLEEAGRFFDLVRAGFSQPRKQVKNSLSAGLGAEPGAVVGWLEAAKIDPRRRPEKLAVDDWLRLYRAAYRG